MVMLVDVSSTFIENIFRSGLTLVSSNDIKTIKIDKNKLRLSNGKRTQIMRWKKDNLRMFTLKKMF